MLWDGNWIHKIVERFVKGLFGLVNPHLRLCACVCVCVCACNSTQLVLIL